MTVMHRCESVGCTSSVIGWSTLLSAEHTHGVAKLVQASRPRVLEAGQALYAQGDAFSGIYCVQSGLVGIRRVDEDGNCALLAVQSRGDVLGYRALLSQSAHANSAEALTTCRVCFMEASQFHALLDRNPALRDAFLHRALAELGRVEAKCATLLTGGMKPRLLQLLYQFAEGHEPDVDDGITFDVPLQRKDMAALIGATPESLSRLINRLGEQGIVTFEGRKVTVFPSASKHGFRAAAQDTASRVRTLFDTLMEARHALLSMLHTQSSTSRDTSHARVLAASRRLDALLASPCGYDARMVSSFKTIWEQFKATRQHELIPAIYAGRIEHAKRIATGVQAQRLAEMKGCLIGYTGTARATA